MDNPFNDLEKTFEWMLNHWLVSLLTGATILGFAVYGAFKLITFLISII